MPIQLPKAFITLDQPDADVMLAASEIDPGLSANRLTQYRFELLDRDENFIGLLNSVEASGSIAWSAAASIKAGGELSIQDLKVIPGYPTITEYEVFESNLATNPNLESSSITGWNSGDTVACSVASSTSLPIVGARSALATRLGVPLVGATNIATNPNLEANVLTNWNAIGALYPLALDSVAKISGSYSAVTTRSATTPSLIVSEVSIGQASGTNAHIPCTAGVALTTSIDVRVEWGGRRIKAYYEWYNAANALTTGSATTFVSSTTAMKTERIALVGTPPSGTTGFRIRLLVDLGSGGSVTGERVWYDNLKTGTNAEVPYFDGASPNSGYTHNWVGTANASASEKKTNPGGVTVGVNSHPNPNLEGGTLVGCYSKSPDLYPLTNSTSSPISGTRSAMTTRSSSGSSTMASALIMDLTGIQPFDISDLKLWFNADDLNALANGAAISNEWSSRQGSCVTSQGTSGNRPTKQVVGADVVVRFDGVNDALSLGGDALTFSKSKPAISAVSRAKMSATPAVGNIISVSGATATRYALRTVAGEASVGGRRNDDDGFEEIFGGTLGTSVARTQTGILDYQNSNAYIYLDGTLEDSDTGFQSSGNSDSTNSGNSVHLGAIYDADEEWQAMDLYELAVYSKALSTAERQAVEAHVASPGAHFPVTAGIPITASVDVKIENSGRRITTYFTWFNAVNLRLGSSVIQTQDPAALTVVRQAQTAIPPVGATQGRWDIEVTRIGSNANSGERVWYDNFRWAAGAQGTADYFDGSTAAIPSTVTYAWTGTANLSTSTRSSGGTGTSPVAASVFLTPRAGLTGFACTPGVPITFSFDIKVELAARRVQVGVDWLSSINAIVATEPLTTPIASTTALAVVRLTQTYTPPVGAVTMRPKIIVSRPSGDATLGERVWFDQLLITTAGDIPYFDGNSGPGYRWSGVPNLSISEKYTSTITPGEPPRYEATNAPIELPETIDWLNSRIKPVIIITDLDTGNTAEYPQGVYLPAAPVEEWRGGQRSWRVELLDKTSILDSDVYTSGGRPATYTLVSGANVVAAIVSLIHSTGETTPAIQADPSNVLAAGMTWDMGTTLLKIINDLLNAANYFSIFTDEQGQFQLVPYVAPLYRAPVYEVDSPISYGELSRMDPSWTLDNDIYAIPNRIVLVGQGSDEVPAWVATAINNNPSNPFSYVNRGRWVTYVETEVEAVSEAALQAQAERKLQEATGVSRKMAVKHTYLPEIKINRLLHFVNSRAELDTWCVISNTEVSFDPLALCSTNLTEVASD